MKVSWSGGVSFKQAAAIVARNGITFEISAISEFSSEGKIPIIKISVIPNGSISALGISGKASPFQIDCIDFFPTLLNWFLKKISELVNLISIIEFRDSLIILLETNSTSNLFLVAYLM